MTIAKAGVVEIEKFKSNHNIFNQKLKKNSLKHNSTLLETEIGTLFHFSIFSN